MGRLQHGESVKLWRKHLGKTAKWLSAESGIEHTALCKVEKGKRRLLVTEWEALALALGITPEQLREGPPADSDEADELDGDKSAAG